MCEDHEPEQNRDPLETAEEVWRSIISYLFNRKNAASTTAAASIATAIFTGALVVVTIAYTIFSARQWRAAEANASAAKTAANVAGKTLELSNRPWLSATLTQNGPLHFGPSGAGMEVQFHLKNVGHTPSIDTRYHASIVSLPQKTWVAVEIRDAEKKECDSFPQYFFSGSPQFLPVIFPNEEPAPAQWPASINPKGIQNAVAEKLQGPFRHDGFVSLYLVACVEYRTAYSSDFYRSAYGFNLGIPDTKYPGMWMGDLKPEGVQPNVRLIFMDSFAN